MTQGGLPLAGGALRNVRSLSRRYAIAVDPRTTSPASQQHMKPTRMKNEPSHNDSDLSRPSQHTVDHARGLLILRKTYAKGLALGFSLGAFSMFAVCFSAFMIVRQLR